MEKYIGDRIQIAVFEANGKYDLFILLDGRLVRPVLQGVTRECAARIARALLDEKNKRYARRGRTNGKLES